MTEITFETTAQDVASRSFQVTVPTDLLNASERRAVKEYASRVRLPGFRKGHAPEPVVRRRFSNEIRQYVLEDVVRESWKQLMADDSIKPIADPQISNLSFEPDAPLTFQMLIEVQPSIELTTTGGFNLTRKLTTVSDADVDEQIEKLRERKAAWQPVEGVRPKEGQLVSVTVETLIDGEVSVPGSPHEMVLGDGQAIPDLEERITTLLPGESIDTEVRLPEDHPDEARRGEVRTVRIALHEVKEQILPDLDDAFAAEVGDFADLDGLRKAVREDLESDAVRGTESELREQLIARLVEANEVPAPPTLVRRLMQSYAEAYQVPAEQQEAFGASFGPIAETQVRRELVLNAVSTAQNLRASEAEIDQKVAERAAARGIEPAKLYAQLEQAKRLGELEREVTEEKTFNWLLGQSTVTEEPA